MIDAAGRRELDMLFSIGGNFLEVLPDPTAVRDALASVPLRVHMDIVVSSQMLADPGEEVLLLPATTRYEVPGGVTETTTERRVIFSPEVRGPRIAEARPEWEVLTEIVARARPGLADHIGFADTAAIREEIAAVVPAYEGIGGLREQGDQFQYGGERLCEGPSFPTPDGRARFSPVGVPTPAADDGLLVLSTRRGKQFNTIVHERSDAITGAARNAILVSGADAGRLGIADGQAVIVSSAHGVLKGRALISPIAPGNVQVHWPEGNILIGGDARSPESGIPDFNARVSLRAA
jgi:anaerobic selenocysteine-containing dehydrogenase